MIIAWCKMDNIKENKIFLVFLILLFVKLTIELMKGIINFDGAMNMQTVINLAYHGIYAGNYPEYTLFDPKVQTGITVLLPIAIFIKFFGTSFQVAQLTNYLYILLLFYMIYKIMYKLNLDIKYFYFTIIAILYIPRFFEFATGVLGEIPALSLILASIYILTYTDKETKNRNIIFLLSGILASFSFLAKTVLLIGVASVLFFLLLNVIDKKVVFKEFIIWIIGFIIPVMIFELYKLIVLGGIKEYISWTMNAINAISAQAGVVDKYKDEPNLYIKIVSNIKLLIKLYDIYAITSFISIIGGLVLLIKNFKVKRFNYLYILLLIGIVYLIWWIVITPTEKAWPRRIINGIIILNICFFIIIGKIDIINRIICQRYLIKVIMILVFILFINTIMVQLRSGIGDEFYIRKVSEYIKEIKNKDNNAVFCGFGWMQAPVISYYSQINFKDYYKIKEEIKLNNKNVKNKINYYLISDYYATILAKDYVDKILSEYEYDVVYKDKKGKHYVYKLNKIK